MTELLTLHAENYWKNEVTNKRPTRNIRALVVHLLVRVMVYVKKNNYMELLKSITDISKRN